MKKIGLSLFVSVMLTGQVLAQTPTPVQPRKTIRPPEPTTSSNIPSYCADSLRVFRGVLTYSEKIGYSVDFKYPLCFTDGKEIFKINRILLVLWHPQHNSYMKHNANQRVRLVINNFKMEKINNELELVASNYLIIEDS